MSNVISLLNQFSLSAQTSFVCWKNLWEATLISIDCMLTRYGNAFGVVLFFSVLFLLFAFFYLFCMLLHFIVLFTITVCGSSKCWCASFLRMFAIFENNCSTTLGTKNSKNEVKNLINIEWSTKIPDPQNTPCWFIYYAYCLQFFLFFIGLVT